MTEQTEGAEAAEMVRGIWRDAAEKGIKDGVDWPKIVLSLFRSLDEARAREAAAEARGAQAVLAAVEALSDEWERLATGNEASRGRPTRVAGYYRRCSAQVLTAARAAAAAAGGGA